MEKIRPFFSQHFSFPLPPHRAIPLPLISRALHWGHGKLFLISASFLHIKSSIQRGVVGRVKGFVNKFLRVPLALLGQHGSCSTGPNSQCNSQKNLLLNLPSHTVEARIVIEAGVDRTGLTLHVMI